MKTADIATRLGHHPAAVCKHIALFKKMPKKKRKGCISKITSCMKERRGLFVLGNLFKSARELKNKVLGWSDISVRRIQFIPAEGAQHVIEHCCQKAAANL
jgi:hypothetical protein